MRAILIFIIIATDIFIFEFEGKTKEKRIKAKRAGETVRIFLCGILISFVLIILIGGINAMLGNILMLCGLILLGTQQQLFEKIVNDKSIGENIKKVIWFVIFIFAFAVYCSGIYFIAAVFSADISELANLP